MNDLPPAALLGHQTRMDWMGEPVVTLADLIPAQARALLVGINPTPVSVAAGHYYQGQLGQGLFRRLRASAVLPSGTGWEDDLALTSGIGFTDIIKRPTPSADGLGVAEYRHGRQRLERTLEASAPRLVVFTFKAAAKALFGDFEGSGLMPGLSVGPSSVFVMPGPYEARGTATAKLADLREFLETR